MTSRTGIFIDNAWRPSASGETLPVIAPAEGAAWGAIAAGGAEDIDAAVASARHAFEDGAWGRLTAAERGRILSRLGRLCEDHHEQLAALEARDTGKPLKQARADATATARYFEYYGAAADKLHGDTIPFLEGYFVATVYEPKGVTGHIIPWNYPAQIFGRSVGASLAVGNACVLKPAEEACQTPLFLAELAAEAGLPPGALNVVPGLGEQAGAALANHKGVDFLSFTGSPDVGTLIQTAAARNHIGCTLELGGKSPQIVFADADQDAAISAILNAIVQNAGQTCSAGSRLLVEASLWDRLLPDLAARFAQVTAGTPEMDRELGPLISRTQMDRVQSFPTANARLLAQGRIADGVPKGGYFVKPALYAVERPDCALWQEEVFGPILAAMPFRDEAEAIKLANGTDFGLVAGVWSRDGARAMRVARKVKAGQVYINGYGAGGGIELPFGGVKKSGHGREKGFEGLRDFAALKTLVFKHGT